MIEGNEIFKQSRALKTISTDTKTYVRTVRDILRKVINPDGPRHPWQSFDYEKAGIMTHCEYRTFTEYLDKWSRLTLKQLRDLFHNDAEITNLLDVATGSEVGFNNIKDLSERAPVGTTKAAGLRRLRKDRPETSR